MKNIIHTLVKTTLYYWLRITSAPVVFIARWWIKHSNATPVQKVELLELLDELEQYKNELKEN